MNKTVVIGLDGLEPSITEAMLRAGQLPNLRRICEQGGYSRLRTTYPAQTPVAWSTFSTGTNPGGHGIFDFLSRDPVRYLPMLALSHYEQKNAFAVPKVVNMRRGVPFWELLSAAGVPSVVLRCPCTYPPAEVRGRILAGVGVPDLRGGLGTSTYYTTADGVRAEHSEKVVCLVPNGGRCDTYLVGPRHPKTQQDVTSSMVLQVVPSEGKLVVHSEHQPSALTVRVGEWSDWLHVKFKVGMFQTTHGIVRFYLRAIEPHIEFYASPINFAPDDPLFPISAPERYAGELQAALGTYHTAGMAEDHDGLNNGRFDESAYLHQCTLVMHEREKMMLAELARIKEGFFFCLFDTPDRLQHMFWRFRDPGHPANRNGMAPEFVRTIEEHYQKLDAIVGRVLAFVDERTHLIVLSDHGMNSFRRGLHLNTWLHANGYLALKSGIRPGDEENSRFFHHVDWDRTRAYALGLGGIYLNLRGRESNGIVAAGDADEIKAAISRSLTGLGDAGQGLQAVRSVLSREQLYRGPYASESPDLLVNFAEGYRVSWATPLGGVPAGLFEDNQKKWAGDHVIDPELVPGVLFMNQRFDEEAPCLADLAPTILHSLAVAPTEVMEGRSLLR